MRICNFFLISISILYFCIACSNDNETREDVSLEKKRKAIVAAMHDFEARSGTSLFTDEDYKSYQEDADSIETLHFADLRIIPDSLRSAHDDSIKFTAVTYVIDTSGFKVLNPDSVKVHMKLKHDGVTYII